MRFCPICSNYLFLQNVKTESVLEHLCRHCGYKETVAPKTAKDALILETTFSNSEKSQAISYLNEYTITDPTLPHLKTISCPNNSCQSQSDVHLRDILYVKTDAKHLKYQYSCTICKFQWSS